MILLDIVVFALAGALKGGWHKKFIDANIDGTHLSIGLVLIFSLFVLPWLTALLFSLGWALVSASMGEEAGAAGDYHGWWGDYEEAIYPPGHPDAGKKVFDRSYGVKKGIQYGLQMGGVMALALGNWCPAIAGASFPAVYYAGSSIHYFFHKKHSWTYAEPLWGAVFGIAFYLATKGILNA